MRGRLSFPAMLVPVLAAACSSSTSGPNRPPVAQAGPDQEAEVDQPVTLDGSGSFDPDGDTLSFEWAIAAAPQGASVDGALPPDLTKQMVTTLKPDRAGIWLVRLTVSDPRSASASDVAEIRVAGRCESDNDCRDGVDCTHASCEQNTHVCRYTPDDGLCPDDGFFCNGGEYCDARQGCLHRGDPCPGNCDEQHDRCGDCGDGTVNAAAGEQCDPGEPQNDHCCDIATCAWVASGGSDPQGFCSGAGECQRNICDGAGNCGFANVAAGSPCGDRGVVCHVDDTCDGAGGCTDNGFVTDGTECGSRSCAGLSWVRQTCQQGNCTGSEMVDCNDGNECTQDSCTAATGCDHTPLSNGTLCNDNGLFCDGVERCQGGICTSSGDPCPGVCDEQNDRCGSCGDGTVSSGLGEQCDFGEPKNDHCCNPTTCRWVAIGDTDPQGFCGGAQECQRAVCDGAGGCTLANAGDGDPCGSQRVTPCDNADSCFQGECSPNYLPSSTVCRPADGECDVAEYCPGDGPDCPADEFLPDDTLCSGDTFACTDDTCQGGVCNSIPNDDLCFASALCVPECSLSSSGCVSSPGLLTLDCNSPVDLNVSNESPCTITLSAGGDVTGQEECLDCTARVGVTTLVSTDFTNDSNPSLCSLDGWSISSGNECYSTGNACPMPGNFTRDCCDNFICPIDAFNTQAFAADRDTCTNGDHQWKLQRTFNATGLENLELCFDYADNGAAGNNDILQVDVADAAGRYQANVFCDGDGPRNEVDDVWYRTCVDLTSVSFAAGNPALKIIFFLHSNDNNNRIYIDNLTLKGISSSCPAVRETIFSENFDNCPNPLDGGWNDWSLWGTIRCVTNFNCPDNSTRAEVDNISGTMWRYLDASAYEDIQVCFHFGDDGTSSGGSDNFTFSMCTHDCGIMANWVQAWHISGNAGPDQNCSRVCVNLSDRDVRANYNPSLGISFRFVSDGGKYDLDNIEVTGSRPCDATGVITLTTPRDPDNNGTYTFRAIDQDEQLTGIIDCHWTPDPNLRARQRVWFGYP